MLNFLNEKGSEIIANVSNYREILKKLASNQKHVNGSMGLDHISLQIRQGYVTKNNKIKESDDFISVKKKFNMSMELATKKLESKDSETRHKYAAILLYDFDSGAIEALKKITLVLKQLQS